MLCLVFLFQIVFGPLDKPFDFFIPGAYSSFLLNTPIVWDGVSNLVIDISASDSDWGDYIGILFLISDNLVLG